MNDGRALGWSPGKDFHGGFYLVGLITGVSALRGEARQTGKPLCSAECLKIFLKNLSHVVVLSDVWQSMQFMLVAAENIPIVSMNSSTGIPLMIWRFLKTSSAIWGLGA